MILAITDVYPRVVLYHYLSKIDFLKVSPLGSAVGVDRDGKQSERSLVAEKLIIDNSICSPANTPQLTKGLAVSPEGLFLLAITVTTHVVRLKLFRLKAEGGRRARLPNFGGNI